MSAWFSTGRNTTSPAASIIPTSWPFVSFSDPRTTPQQPEQPQSTPANTSTADHKPPPRAPDIAPKQTAPAKGPEFVAVGEDTVVANEIEAWGRDEGSEEGVAGDNGEGGPVASGLLEAQAEQIDKVLAIARERIKERGQVLRRSSESPTA